MTRCLAFSAMAMLLAVTTPVALRAEAGKAHLDEPDGSAVVFGRSLNIEGTPLRLERRQSGSSFRGIKEAKLGGIRPSGLPLRANWISSGFGMRFHPLGGGARFHGGLDFPAPAGTVVHATAPGVVVYAGWNGGYGLCLVIEHGGGTTTLFGHLSSISTNPGDSVGPGQVIGRVGSTGRSTGPHLHYEVRQDGRPVDPRTYL